MSGRISFEVSNGLRWEVGFELPKTLLPEDVRERELYKFGWTFYESREVYPKDEAGISISTYAFAFRAIAKQFNRWADFLERVAS